MKGYVYFKETNPTFGIITNISYSKCYIYRFEIGMDILWVSIVPQDGLVCMMALTSTPIYGIFYEGDWTFRIGGIKSVSDLRS